MGSAIVTLLDEPHWRRVEDLWRELDREFGLRGVAVTPFPHFSYQVAEDYDLAVVEPGLQRAARHAVPFTVKTGGMGIFTGPQPVLYLQVVRSPALTRFHQALWPELERAGRGVFPYYRPESWVPHITLAHGDLTRENLGGVVAHLAERDFSWELPVDNLALIHDAGGPQEIRCRFRFEGG